ncbi:MAG: type secretion system protein [Actinomycetota bacterium]
MTSFTQLTIDPELDRLLRATVSASASDLHLTLGRPPMVRLSGDLIPIEGMSDLGAIELDRMIGSLMDEAKTQEFNHNHQVDFSFGINGVGRFRANAFRQRGCMALALRVVPHRISPLDELGAPAACSKLLNAPYGLVLVVGPTGSGKSTTLAAMIDQINRDRACHILTIEDPVEFVHTHKRSLVNQREVGTDVNTFEDGLRSALREDPDVILLGEMRDLESIAITLTLAETGHLVFATLHTNDASQALDRIVDVFPAERRDQIQIQLAGSLQGIISQRLIPSEHGGRVAAYEALIVNDRRNANSRNGPGTFGHCRPHHPGRCLQPECLPQRSCHADCNATLTTRQQLVDQKDLTRGINNWRHQKGRPLRAGLFV